MKTEVAQRRLLEALADLYRVPSSTPRESADPLAAFIVGVRVGVVDARQSGEDESADVFAAFADLAQAVHADLKENSSWPTGQ